MPPNPLVSLEGLLITGVCFASPCMLVVCSRGGWWWPLAGAPGMGTGGSGQGGRGGPQAGRQGPGRCWQLPTGRKSCKRHCTGQNMSQGACEGPGTSQGTGVSPSHWVLLTENLSQLLLWKSAGPGARHVFFSTSWPKIL